MIRDDQQTALDEAIVALQNEAVHQRDAAGRVEQQRLSDVLRDTADRCEAHADRLKPDMEALHDLPSEPDQEAEFLEGLFSRIQAVLSGDTERAVVQERIEGLGQLRQCLQNALDTAPPQPIEEHLQTALEFVVSARQQLQNLAS